MLIRAILLAALSLIVVGPVTAEEAVPFDPSGGLVIVNVTIDGKAKGKFGVDTGADFLYVDRQFALDNDLNFTQNLATRGVFGLEGSDSPSLLSISSLAIGDEAINDVKAMAIDMSQFVTDPRATRPDGLIGSEILSQFYVTIDYPNSTLALSRSKPEFLRGKNYSSVFFHLYKKHIIVESSIDEHDGILMLFDYCASVTALSPALAERLGLPVDDRKFYRVDLAIDDNFKSSDVVTVTRDLTNIKKTMPRAQFDGIIGASFLRDHKVTIDYDRKMMYVHK